MESLGQIIKQMCGGDKGAAAGKQSDRHVQTQRGLLHKPFPLVLKVNDSTPNMLLLTPLLMNTRQQVTIVPKMFIVTPNILLGIILKHFCNHV
jgi:hypothetical protein